MTASNTTIGSLAAVAMLSILPACSTYTSGLKSTTTDAAAVAADVTYDSARAIWEAERGTAEGLQKAIDALNAVTAAATKDSGCAQDAHILLARSYYFMADAHTVDADAKNVLFERGVTEGEKAMACDAAFKAQVDKGTKPAEAVSALQKDDQMAIYWTASNLGKWARGQGFSTIVKYKGYIGKMMAHCLELDETAYYAGPVRYWGAFYSIAPSFAGGDMTKSQEMYEKAIKMSPENFATYVLYADTYATKTQDKALFTKLLTTVVEGDAAALPDMIPEQLAEQAKAKAFLAQADDLFAE